MLALQAPVLLPGICLGALAPGLGSHCSLLQQAAGNDKFNTHLRRPSFYCSLTAILVLI